MANTIKFGNGQWATKEDSILAYNDENANFKPLPFVASRTSTATRVNKSGLLETVGVGIPRVDYLSNTSGAYLLEPSSTNLITQSESFGNSYWTKSGASIEGDVSTAGSEQVLNGDFATDTDWSKGTGWTIGSGVSSCDGTQYGSQLSQNILTANKNYILTFDITSWTSGDVGLNSAYYGVSAYFEGVGSYSVQFNSQSQVAFRFYSQYFIGSIDNVSVKEVQGFSAPSVDNPTSAFKLVEDTSNGEHKMDSSTISSASGNYVTSSAYVKSAENSFVVISISDNLTGVADVVFDIDNRTGTTSSTGNWTNVTYKIDVISNGFIRISARALQGAGTTIAMKLKNYNGTSTFYTGDGTSGVYIFGAQFETQSSATSYIPTAGTAISRTADSASLLNLDTNNLVNDNGAWTVFFELELLGNNSAFDKIALTDSTNIPRVYLYHKSVGVAHSSWSGSAAISMNTNNKIIYRANSDKNISFFNNGTNLATFTSSDTPIVFNRIKLNGRNGAFKIKQIQVYNTTLTDSECVTLTTI